MMRTILLCISALALSGSGLWGTSDAVAATLDPHALGLPQLRYGAMAWAVPDTSSTIAGKSLLAMTGLDTDGKLRTYIIRIAPGLDGQPAVVEKKATEDTGIPGVVFGQMDWADYDRDGLLDLAIAGRTGNVADTAIDARTIALVYRQRSDGTFVVPSDFPTDVAVDSCVVRWVDYNVDGFVDLFISGRTRNRSTDAQGRVFIRGESRVYMLRNVTDDGIQHRFEIDDGVTSRVDQIVPLHGGDADWADMNGDGTPDLAICGLNVTLLQGSSAVTDTLTDVYINDPPGVLTRNLATTIPPRYGGGVAWGDVNGDGKLDLAITGRQKRSDGGNIALEVWENLGIGKFKKVPIDLDAKYSLAGRLTWADVNNDGWLDIVSMGDSSGGAGAVSFYANDHDETFSPIALTAPAPALTQGSFALGHLDTDGTLDLVASGYNTATGAVESYAWTMAGMPRNDPPQVGQVNFPDVTGDKIIFRWDEASDLTNDGTSADNGMLTYEVLMYLGQGGLKALTSRAAFGPGPHGRSLLYTLYRTLSPHPGMPLYYRAVDPSGVTSNWSAMKLVRVEDFVSSEEVVVGVARANAAWADVNNDGQPDLVVNGFDQGGNATTRLFLDKDGKFDAKGTFAKYGVYFGGQGWGDVNGDGYLDLLLTGRVSEQKGITRLFLNRTASSGGFEDVGMPFSSLRGARAVMGDVDNDGDMDIIATGIDSVAAFKTFLAENIGTVNGVPVFRTRELKLRPDGKDQGVVDGWLTLYDYDQDGDLDLTMQGSTNAFVGGFDFGGILEIYQNDGKGNFTPAIIWTAPRSPALSALPLGDTKLDQVDIGEHAWADITGPNGAPDGLPDLVVIGFSNVTSEFSKFPSLPDGGVIRIYENTGGGNLKLKQSMPGLIFASLAAADFDNDGDVDLLTCGFDDHDPVPVADTPGNPVIRYYRNTGDSLQAVSVQLFAGQGRGGGAVRAADLDGDSDLDAIVVGQRLTEGKKALPFSTVYTNTNASILVNRRSSPPGGLEAVVDTTRTVRFLWEEAFDPDFRTDHHTYALRVGTAPGAGDVRPGVEQVGPGDLGYRKEARLVNLRDGRYYWNVQSVDNGWRRSPWLASDETFVIDTTPPRVVRLRGDTLSVGADQIISVAIAFFDSLTGVDESASNMSVKLSILGSAPVTVAQDPAGWQPGSVWLGQAKVPAGTFLSEPVTIRVSGVRDVRGNLMPDTSITTRLISSLSYRITRERGGSLTNSSATISLYVPPHSVGEDVRVSLSEPDQAALPAGPGPAMGMAVEFVPDVAVNALNAPAILTMKYGAAPKAAAVRQASDLHVFRLDGTTWQYVGGRADETAGTISVAISELGVYGLFEASVDVTEPTLGALSCSPRVFSPGTSQGFSDHTEISFSVASADVGEGAWIKIYNDAGRLVSRLDPALVAGINTVPWDGKDESGSIAPSGLYIIVVNVNGVQKTKTVAVLNKYAGP